MRNFIEYSEMYLMHPELARELVERARAEHLAKETVKKNHTGSNEKTTQREWNKKRCYALFDEMMEKAPKMRVSEIKKVIAAKMHTTTKTISGYLRERPQKNDFYDLNGSLNT